MKRLACLLLIFLLIFSLTGCGTYVNLPTDDDADDTAQDNGDKTDKPDDNDGKDDESSDDGEDGDDPSEEIEQEFTVSLYYNSEPFALGEDSGISAQWSDGQSVVRAEFDKDGVAKTKGLDGEYDVTLTSLPDGYTYNSNIYKVNNEKTDVKITLYQIEKTRNSGKDMQNNIITISRAGVYRAEVKLNRKGEPQPIYFRFAPNRPGTYSIESWNNVSDDNVNPILDMYDYNAGGWYGNHRVIDGGGVSNVYASNFKFEFKVDNSNLSETGGGVVFAFGVRATAKDGVYPVYIDFLLNYDGGYDNPDGANSAVVAPKELPKNAEEEEAWFALHNSYSKNDYKLVYSYDYYDSLTPEISGDKIQDETLYEYCEEDGYYHVYDPVKYADNDGFGPILYAYIATGFEIVDASFAMVQYAGNKNLTLNKGTLDYSVFIEGAEHLYTNGEAVYGTPIVYPGHENTKGYYDYANSDGLCPVTKELKTFLQYYAQAQIIFFDGNGLAEIYNNVHSGDDSMWLFACVHYEPVR